MRLILAIQCFFAVLFGRTPPERALPPPREPDDKRHERERLAKQVQELEPRLKKLEQEVAEEHQGREAAEKALRAAEQAAAKAREEAAAEAGAKARAEADAEWQAKLADLEQKKHTADEKLSDARQKLDEAREAGALALLAWLQREGRLIDFLREDVDAYDDAQVGAAVRAIHKGCKKVLDEGLALEPILPGDEEAPVTVPAGFDPVAIQLSGKVKGDPPFKGTLVHHGWRTTKVAVPVPETVDPRVLAPAEVEL